MERVVGVFGWKTVKTYIKVTLHERCRTPRVTRSGQGRVLVASWGRCRGVLAVVGFGRGVKSDRLGELI